MGADVFNHLKTNNRQAGYSLLGVTLFLVVAGILVAGGMSMKQRYDWAQNQKVTKDNIATVRAAIKRFQEQNIRLPCPASMTTGPGNVMFAKETDCNVAALAGETFEDNGRANEPIRYGAVPVRSLGLPDSVLVDGWGHRLVYGVTKYYAMGEPDFSLDKGAIKIVGGKGSQDLTNTSLTNEVDGNIIYTVVSPGADERGAFTFDGVKIDECYDQINCKQGDGKMQVSIFRQYNSSETDITSATNKDFTATMAFEASSKTYEWRAGNWSSCSCSNPTTSQRNNRNRNRNNASAATTAQSCCLNPTRTRTVTCHVKGSPANSTPVNDSYCGTMLKPAISDPCPKFCWDVEFPSCPGGCGPDVTIRGTLFCKENTTKKVVFNFCEPAPRPPTTKVCHRSPCPPPPSTGGGYVDTDGDGKGDTHIRDMPPGTNLPSSEGKGQNVSSSTPSHINANGQYGGDVKGGDEGNAHGGYDPQTNNFSPTGAFYK